MPFAGEMSGPGQATNTGFAGAPFAGAPFASAPTANFAGQVVASSTGWTGVTPVPPLAPPKPVRPGP